MNDKSNDPPRFKRGDRVRRAAEMRRRFAETPYGGGS